MKYSCYRNNTYHRLETKLNDLRDLQIIVSTKFTTFIFCYTYDVRNLTNYAALSQIFLQIQRNQKKSILKTYINQESVTKRTGYRLFSLFFSTVKIVSL